MRQPVAAGAPIVVKVGSSSLTNADGGLDDAAVRNVVQQVASMTHAGHPTVLVTSAAIAAGLPSLGMTERPTAIADLQVAAAMGQTKLMERYSNLFKEHGVVVGQVLLTKDVLGNRNQYLNARNALVRMLEFGFVPIVNENDTVVVDEVKFGDNDRLAAIASHLISAGMLIILTDTSGLFTEDPWLTSEAKLLTAIAHSDEVLDRIRAADGRGTFGSGGVATKVVAARMAAFSGIPTVIASAREVDGVQRAVAGDPVGTWVSPRQPPLNARKLWIAFGLPASGTVSIDKGAVDALTSGGRSLLAVGVKAVTGSFDRGDAVEVLGIDGTLCAKGITRVSSIEAAAMTQNGGNAVGIEFIHRDDLVVMV